MSNEMKREEIRFVIGESTLGPVLVAESVRGICALLFGDGATETELKRRFPAAELCEDDALAARAAEVAALVEAPSRELDVPLDLRGTAFQQSVWAALREIPTGKTATYADVARQIGQPGAVRAVAQACGANPVAVIVPCHRVIRSDGGLSGYRWGVERKRALLEREAA